MHSLTTVHITAASITLLAITFLGLRAGKSVRNASDFSDGGRSASALLVTGAILGTLIGGSSTIGTAQLACRWGLSAWWFTLGASLGCVALFFLVDPLRNSRCLTIQQMIASRYGVLSGIVTSILTTLGIVLNIVAQILAANALFFVLFGLPPEASAALTVVIMASYMAGGVKGAGLLGIVKMVLIYAGCLAGGAVAFHGLDWGVFESLFPAERYLNLFARGIGPDLGAGLSVMLGVVSTQTYIQAILSAKNSREARKGALLGALLIPPIGILSILVGYFMMARYPTIDPAQAFPLFVVNCLPPAFGGVILAALLIAVVGTGAGMALGFGTIVTNDLYLKFINPKADSSRLLWVNRMTILASLIVSALFVLWNRGSAILRWGFLSMGLRAVVLLVPMLFTFFTKERVGGGYVILSSSLGLAAMLAAERMSLPVDGLFLGTAASFFVMYLGWRFSRDGSARDYKEE